MIVILSWIYENIWFIKEVIQDVYSRYQSPVFSLYFILFQRSFNNIILRIENNQKMIEENTNQTYPGFRLDGDNPDHFVNK